MLKDPVPLAHAEWTYVRKPSLEQYTAQDWSVWSAQRPHFDREQKVKQILRMLSCQQDDPGFIYTINNYYHCLQTATRMLRAGLSEEDVVVGLLHDVGFTTCNETHGEFAAALLRPYISARNLWMLERHMVFQQFHCHNLPGCARRERDRWRDHPYFGWAAEFVARYDQNSISYEEEILPLAAFERLVRNVFDRPPNAVAYP